MNQLPNYQGQSKAQIISAIRKEWMTWPRKFAAIQKKAERVVLDSGRYKTLIRCEHCKALVERTEIQCNHRIPVGPLLSIAPTDIEAYRNRMFCPIWNLEPLCTTCHRTQTTKQRNTQ